MPRWGYAVIAMLALALGVYAFWPQAKPAQFHRVAPDGIGTAVVLRYQGREQRVEDKQVVLPGQGGMRLGLDEDRLKKLDGAWRGLSVAQDRLIAGIDAAAAQAYGIDGSRAIDGLRRLRWGRTDGKGYVFDEQARSIAIVEPDVLDRIEALCGRLDRERLIDLPERLERLEIATAGTTLLLEFRDGGWVAPFQPQRIAWGPRLRRIIALLRDQPMPVIERGFPPPVPVIATVALLTPVRSEIRILAAPGATTGWIAVEGRPAQQLGATQLAAWRQAFAALAEDRVIEEPEGGQSPYPGLVVSRAGTEAFRLRRNGFNDSEDGISRWEVAWPLGREPAAADAAYRILGALSAVVIADPVAVPAGSPPLADALVLTWDRGPVVELSASRIRANGCEGRIVHRPDLLFDLRPEAMFEERLTRRHPDRVGKIQRVWADGRAEVATRSETGTWSRTWPSPGPIDALAAARLARALCQARGGAPRPAGAEGDEVRAKPDFALSVRFLPRSDRKAANDDLVDLEETAAEDAGWAFRRGEGGWLAVEMTGGVARTVDDETVDLLMAALDHRAVVPVVPALVGRIDRRGPDGAWTLKRSGEGWTIAEADGKGGWGAEAPADAVAVRRLLRDAVAASATRVDAGAARLALGETTGSLSFELPGIGLDPRERLTVYIGQAVSGEVPCSTESDRKGAPVPEGRWFLTLDQAAALLPPATRLRATAAP